jgi:hypothetical protein
LLLENYYFMAKYLFLPMIIAARMHKYFFRFKDAGATNPGNPRTLKSLGLDIGPLFDKLVRNEIFIETSPGLYYVNENKYRKYKYQRLSKVLIVSSFLFLLFVFSLVVIIW